jgi:hypothetical protein
MSFNVDGKIRALQDKEKLMRVLFTNPALKKIIKGIITRREIKTITSTTSQKKNKIKKGN